MTLVCTESVFACKKRTVTSISQGIFFAPITGHGVKFCMSLGWCYQSGPTSVVKGSSF